MFLFLDAIWLRPVFWGVVVFSWLMPSCVGVFAGVALCGFMGLLAAAVVVVGGFVFCGEFDPGSGRTLAACLTHASRTGCLVFGSGGEWRTGE